MTAFDVAYQVSELKLNVFSLKAVAEAFSRQFTEPVGENRILSIQNAEEEYEYLFRAVFSLICEIREQVIHLEESAEKLLEQKQEE